MPALELAKSFSLAVDFKILELAKNTVKHKSQGLFGVFFVITGFFSISVCCLW
jgi:hypothetical protein